MKPLKPLKLITSVAAVACALAVSSAQAQITNLVTLNVLTVTQGATTTNGSTITFSATKAPHSTPQLLQEIGQAINVTFTSPKLVLVTGNGAMFGVLDGANFYDLSSSGYDIMNIDFPGNNKIKAGTQTSGSTARKTVEMQLISISYDDTSYSNGSLQFSLQGLGVVTQADTAPSNGTYTETTKAKISNLTGEGSSTDSNGSHPFVATGMMNVSGKGTLPAF